MRVLTVSGAAQWQEQPEPSAGQGCGQPAHCVIGAAGGSQGDVQPNREFDDLWLRFVSSAAQPGPQAPPQRPERAALAGDALSQPLALDLSRVASQYIGETEKNIERLFDDAQRSDASLLFDESDELFGTRTDVRDAHDRYAAVLAQHPAGCSCSACSKG